MDQRTWPIASSATRYACVHFDEHSQLRREPRGNHRVLLKRRENPNSTIIRPSKTLTCSSSLSHDFSSLPFDVLRKIAATFTVPNLRAASMVCRSWREALQPLREAMVLIKWGKKFKHGLGGIRPNIQKALDSFLKGAARGSAPAMVDAGLIYWEMGKKEEGVALYKKAAALGDPSGQCNLGIFYLQDEPPQPEEAVKWFHLAAVKGHARAQYNVALCLHQGRGLKGNLTEAAKWYLRAAEGGNVRAMYNTSLCYSSGEGLIHSDRQARHWMKKAADYGHSKAQFEHGLRLFSAGEMIKALTYLELALRAGETAAIHIKNVLVHQLSPASRERAMTSANNWRALRSSH